MENATMDPETKLEAIARKYGIDPAKLAERMKSLAKLKAKDGLIVDLDIGKWSAQAKLREEDLGIEISEEERKFVSLGHQKLFPPEIVNRAARAESQGRDNLERSSFLSAEGRFVPTTAWEDWKAKNEEARKAFFSVRDEIVARYDQILAEVETDYRKRASAVYDRLESLSTKPEATRAAWTASYVSRLLGRIPKKEEIHARFYWEEKYRFLRLPSEIEEEMVRQERARRDRDLLHYENEDRRRKIEEMNRSVADQLRKEKEQAAREQSDFFQKVMLQQRKAVLDCTTAAVAAIRKNKGKVLGPTVKALRNLVEKGRLLNFYDDSEVSQAVDQIEKFLAKEPKRRSARSFTQVVDGIRQAMEKSVRALENEAAKEEEVCRIIGQDLVESVRTID